MRAHNINSEELLINSQYMSPFAVGRNLYINGGFDIWQRGTGAFTATGYTADRWKLEVSGDTASLTQATYPSNYNNTYYLQTGVTTGSGASNYTVLYQKIENVKLSHNKDMVFSAILVSTGGAANVTIEPFQYFGATDGYEYLTPTKVAIGATPTRYEIPISFPSIGGEVTIDSLSLSCFGVFIWLSAGSDFNTRTDSLGNQSLTFQCADVQLEYGSSATDFERRNIALELQLCQRYYEKSFNEGGIPGTTASYLGCEWVKSSGILNDGFLAASASFSVTKRSIPTVYIYSPASGTINKCYNGSIASDVTCNAAYASQNTFSVQANQASFATAANEIIYFQWSAEAEI